MTEEKELEMVIQEADIIKFDEEHFSGIIVDFHEDSPNTQEILLN